MKFVMLAAAQAPAQGLPEVGPGAKPFAPDLTFLLMVAAGLGVLLLLWAMFIRGPKKHPEERDRKPLGVTATKPEVTMTDDGRERHRKKKRVRRRDHRDRYPTLAQTGGLPAPRDPQESTPI
jgi:hypothetical protein